MSTVSNKAIFYHIPKTGGTWVSMMMRFAIKHAGEGTVIKAKEDILNSSQASEKEYWATWLSFLLGMRRGHVPYFNAKEEDKKGRFSFAFVREPVSWYKSRWVDRRHAYHENKGNFKFFLADWLYDDDFETYVNNHLDTFPGGYVTTLYKLFTGLDGKALDFVGKQENLREDLIKALTMAGEEVDEELIRTKERVNTKKSRKGFDGKIEVSDSLRRRIRRNEFWVYETFGY